MKFEKINKESINFLDSNNKLQTLNDDARDKVLNSLGRVDSEIDENTQSIHLTPTGFTADHFSSLRVDRTFATNVNGISFDGNTWKIEHADSIIINSQHILTDVDNFDIDSIRFRIISAESVRFSGEDGFILIENVTDSTFRIGNNIEITANDDVDYFIEDLAGNEIEKHF